MNVSSTRGPQRARFGRFVLTGMLVAAPITLIPIALAGSASASESTVPVATIGAAQVVSVNDVAGYCAARATWSASAPTVNADGTASITVVPEGCEGATLSLAAYTTNGPDWWSAGEQSFQAIQTKVVNGPTSFSVTVPSCYFQLDLITGSDAPATLPSGEAYFSDHDRLLAHYNGGTTACAVLPSSTATTPPVTTSSSTPPVTTSSSTLPTSVEATETSKAPEVVVSTSGPTTPATAVLGETFTKSPEASVAATAATLPFTGSSLPIGPVVALAVELIVAGGAIMMIVSGRRRSQGSHR